MATILTAILVPALHLSPTRSVITSGRCTATRADACANAYSYGHPCDDHHLANLDVAAPERVTEPMDARATFEAYRQRRKGNQVELRVEEGVDEDIEDLANARGALSSNSNPYYSYDHHLANLDVAAPERATEPVDAQAAFEAYRQRRKGNKVELRVEAAGAALEQRIEDLAKRAESATEVSSSVRRMGWQGERSDELI
jgi:hypothetical protein